MTNPYLPPDSTNVKPVPDTVENPRSIILWALATFLFFWGDWLGISTAIPKGPTLQSMVMLACNLVSLGLLVYALCIQRTHRWRILLILSLIVNLLSLAVVLIFVLMLFIAADIRGMKM